ARERLDARWRLRRPGPEPTPRRGKPDGEQHVTRSSTPVRAVSAILVLSSATLSTACGTVRPPAPIVVEKQVLVPIVPPAELRDCGAEPAKPVLTDSRDEASILNDVVLWGRGCRGKPDGTWR